MYFCCYLAHCDRNVKRIHKEIKIASICIPEIFIYFFENWKPTDRIHTSCFNVLQLCIVPTEWICVFRVVLTENSYCFPKNHVNLLVL
jgi:hypothetical protein